jgi:hypothetical protein
MPDVPLLERPPWFRTGARVVRKDDPLQTKYTVDTAPRKPTAKTTLRIRDEASGNIDQIEFGEFLEHFAQDMRTEHRTCMGLDKWGEFNCERAKDHERNPADPNARVHRATLNHRVYEWKGMGASKEVGRAATPRKAG